ncbi:MAG: hypothetical protein AN484_07730 [Aphanizomenon flos-aquae WA102]|uniref:Uncharacterized protein n=1 Tax=Aphanizomenon flos-aquae WA102 TaxID=1710896 RepID=A0A1B7X4H0_APHFL|nr:MAG: hypothetical protein AN484_07730 [Aphanizomenon flos-aquae WA102]
MRPPLPAGAYCNSSPNLPPALQGMALPPNHVVIRRDAAIPAGWEAVPEDDEIPDTLITNFP